MKRAPALIAADQALIASLGGPTRLAALLGYRKGGVQRVFNWTARGIPSGVKLARPDLFLCRELAIQDAPAAFATEAT